MGATGDSERIHSRERRNTETDALIPWPLEDSGLCREQGFSGSSVLVLRKGFSSSFMMKRSRLRSHLSLSP